MRHLTPNEYIEVLLSAEDSPEFACGKCLNSVPSELTELARKGHLEPCPICGSTEIIPNPGNLRQFVKHLVHEGAPLGIIPEFVRFAHCEGLAPAEKGKRHRKSIIFQIRL